MASGQPTLRAKLIQQSSTIGAGSATATVVLLVVLLVELVVELLEVVVAIATVVAGGCADAVVEHDEAMTLTIDIAPAAITALIGGVVRVASIRFVLGSFGCMAGMKWPAGEAARRRARRSGCSATSVAEYVSPCVQELVDGVTVRRKVLL